MPVYKGQGIDWQTQSDSLGVSPLKWTLLTHTFISGLCHLVDDLRQLTCFIGCFNNSSSQPAPGVSFSVDGLGQASLALLGESKNMYSVK